MLRPSALLLLVTLPLLAACGGDPPPGSKGARIVTFTVLPSQITLGQEVTVTWETVGTSGVNIEPRVGLELPKGSTIDRPLVSTSYKLTVPGEDISATAEVTVMSGPRIDALDVSPRSIEEGGSAVLSWMASDADGVTIEPGLGQQAASGTLSVSPSVTTTYQVTAVRGDARSAPSSVELVVTSGNQPRVLAFRATPQAIDEGDTANLYFEVSNATQVTIDNGLGVQPGTQGSVTVRPTQTTRYTLTAIGPGGQTAASVMVAVRSAETPSIKSFIATPDTIGVGGQSELSWDTDAADEVEITPGPGTRLPAKGMLTVMPNQTTEYTITAFALGAGLMATGRTTVTVAGAGQPVVLSFAAQPSAILQGASTTLTWTTQDATSVDVDNGGGTGLPANGSIQVSPNMATTYTLTAHGSGPDATETVSVTVSPPPPTLDSFTAQPASINPGGNATLSWATTNAGGVTIDNGVGNGPATGTVQVSPSQTTTYTLTASGPGGTVMGTVVVSVSAPGTPTITSFTAAPPQITAGAQSTLAWAVQNATSVTLDNGIGSQAVSGSVPVSPGATTTYTLTAIGPGGQSTAQVTVVVISAGDTCGDAFVVAANGTFTGNTLGASNDYSASNGCTGFASTGPDLVYRIQLQAGDRLQATLTPANGTWDASLYLVTSCADVAQSCVAGQDNGNPEEIDFTVLAAGTYYLVVDGYGGAGGAYSLIINVSAAPIGNDQCSGAINVTAGGVFSGDTSNATHQYTPIASGLGGCTGYSALGNDVAYRVTLAAGERLQASLDATWDSSLYLLSNCAAPTSSCLAGQDNGNPEQIDYTSPSAGTFFLIVDGYGTARGGFALTVSISPPATGGDVCASAIAIPAAGGSFQSSTAGLANDYNPPMACTGFNQTGPDQAYRMDLSAGDVVEALAEFDPALDGSIYAVTDCANLAASCVGADVGFSGEAEELRFVARTTSAHYLIVDAVGAASGPHDLTVLRYSGETCPTAAPLDISGQAEWLTTAGRVNDFSPSSTGCTGHTASGPDRVYSRPVNAGDQLEVVLHRDNFDAALYVVTNCADISGSCEFGSDVGITTDEIVAPVFQQATTAYVVVDGYGGQSGTGTILTRVHRGDTCADAYVVPAAGGVFRGTTTGYAANYGATSASGSCTGYSQTGADAVYAITLQAGDQLSASVTTTWDAALYLISNCAQSASTCLTGMDDGNPEAISYTNASGGAQTYYLVVDSWQPSGGGVTRDGAYALTISIQ